MELDCLLVLFHFHTQERLHEAASSDVEILEEFPQKFVLELGTGCCVHHVIPKLEQAVNNEMLTLMLHEDSLPPVDCGIAALFHPVRDVNAPSAGCLLGSIDALEELKAVAFVRVWVQAASQEP